MTWTRLAAAAAIAFGMSGSSCPKQTVKVPLPQQDQSPLVTISNFRPANNGALDQPDSTASSTVNVKYGTNVQFLASARNDAGGVQSFDLAVAQGGAQRYQVAVSANPDANGDVPAQLSIPGTNGAGGLGPNPLLVTVDSPVTLSATARNFNGQATSINVTYNPVGPLQADIAFFPVTINRGQSTTLSWAAVNASQVCVTPGPASSCTWNSPPQGISTLSPPFTTAWAIIAKTQFDQVVRGAVVVVIQPPPAGPHPAE